MPRPHAKFYPSPAQRAAIEYLAANEWRDAMAIPHSTRRVLLQQRIVCYGEGKDSWRIFLTERGKREAARLKGDK